MTPKVLDILSNGPTKIATEHYVITADDLSPLQIKAWATLVSSFDLGHTKNNICCFDALELASRIGLDNHESKEMSVTSIFEELTRKRIKCKGIADRKGERSSFSANLVASVAYNKQTKIIQLEMSKLMLSFLCVLQQEPVASINSTDNALNSFRR
jgi:hypothetical protein